jgi:hypothetical protein
MPVERLEDTRTKFMDVKEAVRAAKEWILDVMSDEHPTNLGLEEVEFDDTQGLWKITLGFSRPWNSNRNALSSFTGEAIQKRAYRTIIVEDFTGRIKGMARKLSAED